MYTVRKTIDWEAAHRLPNHDGKCERLHGHSFEAEIVVIREDLDRQGPKQGMAIDFGLIKDAVAPIIEHQLDHHHLNKTLPVYPTSENIARWLYEKLDGIGLHNLYEVTVFETCTSAATYCPHGCAPSKDFYFDSEGDD